MENKNQPAFPFEYTGWEGQKEVRKVESGLTKREYFAAMAMQGILAANWTSDAELVSKEAVLYADKLLNQLNQ